MNCPKFRTVTVQECLVFAYFGPRSIVFLFEKAKGGEDEVLLNSYKKTRYYLITIQFVFLLLFLTQTSAYCLVDLGNGWMANDIEAIGNSTYKRIGGDPYVIFPELEEPTYVLSGVRLVIRFSPVISKPFLAELFWKPKNGAFHEADKVFFILQPNEKDLSDFIVPIRFDVGYNQIRFDLPRDLNVAFTIEKYTVVPLDSTPLNSKQIEAYSFLSPSEAEELDILIPYILHTLKHGIKRLRQDPFFCVMWFSLIMLSLSAIRITTREMRKK